MRGALPLAGLLLALRPLGSEFRVNTYTTLDQQVAAVASDPGGNFVVVWLSADEHRIGVFGQRFRPTGAPNGGTFRVNTYTTELQLAPSVAPVDFGFVVTWVSLTEDGSSHGIFGQLFASGGAPRGGPFRVNSVTTGSQNDPSVAGNPDGSFVVAFNGEDGDGAGVFLRRFLSTAAPLGAELRVNTATTGFQGFGSVASDATGAFVVVWQDGLNDASRIVARRFGPGGAPLAAEFRVSSATTGGQSYPSVSRSPSGRFVVTWESRPDFTIFGRAFGPGGAPLFPDARVSVYTAFNASTVALADGRFIVVFAGDTEDQFNEVSLRQMDAGGSPIGAPLRMNTLTSGVQTQPIIAAHATGFVVVWTSNASDVADYDVFGRRFSLMPLAGDANGDGAVTVTDVLYLINFLFAGGPAPVG